MPATETVSAVKFCETLVRLAPEKQDVILACARRTGLELRPFCRAIREEIGGTLLLDAVLLFRGGNLARRDDVPSLLAHCLRCRSSACTQSDCLALRSMLAVMKMHASQCKVPRDQGCETCNQWHSVRTKMVEARRNLRKAAPQSIGQAAGAVQANGDHGTDLLMHLARTALADLPPSSPRLSPSNSPSNSPLPKRPKADPKTDGPLARNKSSLSIANCR